MHRVHGYYVQSFQTAQYQFVSSNSSTAGNTRQEVNRKPPRWLSCLHYDHYFKGSPRVGFGSIRFESIGFGAILSVFRHDSIGSVTILFDFGSILSGSVRFYRFRFDSIRLRLRFISINIDSTLDPNLVGNDGSN